MSDTKIPEKIKLRLWLASGGRCQYEGCNKALWRDDLTLAQMNRAYIAHIVGNRIDGPRGDRVLSPKLATEFSNLMLLCDEHHRLVDREQVIEHPVHRLQRMKTIHEARIELVTGIQPEKRTELLLYGANTGEQSPCVPFDRAVQAIIPDRYPSNSIGIVLNMVNSSFRDREGNFWGIEAENLKRLFAARVVPPLATGAVTHLSVFAIAPQPLLVLLGQLLSDIPAVDVYQLHREPPYWCWQAQPESWEYQITRPSHREGAIALILSLSGTINLGDVATVLGSNVSPWIVTIPAPGNDFLKLRVQLVEFRRVVRQVLADIRDHHGHEAVVHVFPAMPVAAAVELGRVLMPKAGPRLRLYDYIPANKRFVKALDLAVSP